MNKPKLRVIDGAIYANSLEMAQKFGKSHEAILKIISRKILAVSSVNFDERDDFIQAGFRKSKYTNSRGQSYPCYELSHDAFDLIAFGLTGDEAIAWQIAYILEFRRMERELRNAADRLKTMEQLELLPDMLREKQYTVSEVLDKFIELGLWQRQFGRNWVMKQIEEGHIEASKPKSVWLVPESSLKTLVTKRKLAA